MASGIDRGIAEYFMGHTFGLDPNNLRLNEELLNREYLKAADKSEEYGSFRRCVDQSCSLKPPSVQRRYFGK